MPAVLMVCLGNLRALAPDNSRAELALLLDYCADSAAMSVPDPYYGGGDGFEQVLDLIEQAADGVLRALSRS